ncbi:MAG: alpha/beta fold hydrolase [Proteobacteria bacterium]|nr:alpha/beta fold hydrolase [Pseudomonadota bacterium]
MHGIGGNRTNWHDQLPAFAARYHAAAWDARGYGLSDDYDGPLDYADFCADLVRVIDHFGARRAHLVGLSMGGLIAQDFYARHGDRVASLVLVDTRPGYEQAFDPRQRAEFLRLRLEPLKAGKEPKDIAPNVAKTLIGPKAPPAIFQRLVDSMTALHKESYIKALEARANWKRVFDPKTVTVPTLVVVGADDTLTPPPMAKSIADAIPGARLAVIPDAGHLSNIEQPAAFNRIVLEFLGAQQAKAAE